MRRRERRFITFDGRRIRGQEAGPEDGELVVLQTGTPGSRYIWEGFIRAGAERGLRQICCSRPGYGGSGRQPGRLVRDCAADVAAVADELGAEEFYVVGISTGADFALACAALLPDRVISAAAMAGFAPKGVDGLDWEAGMGMLNVRELEALKKGPSFLQRYIGDEIAAAGRIESTAQLVTGLEEVLCDADLEVSEGSFLRFQLRDTLEFAKDEIWGWYDDDLAIWGDWGFSPTQIRVPLSLWHGGRDSFIPIAHGEWLAANIPGACPHFFPEEGHISLWARHYGAVLDELLGR